MELYLHLPRRMRWPLAIVLLVSACGEPVLPADADDRLVQGGPPQGDLIINEIAPRSPSGPDFIELYNRSTDAVDLCAYVVTDDIERLDHYYLLAGAEHLDDCAPTLLPSHAYHLVYASGATSEGPNHAPFRLGTTEGAYLVSRQGIPLDSLSYYYPSNAGVRSLARIPNADGSFVLTAETPGAENLESDE